MIQQRRRKKNSSKINLTISFVFHGLLIAAIGYFAAREGMLGKKMQQLAVTMVKEKKAEPPKEKPQEHKVEIAKTPEAPKQQVTEAPKAVATPAPAVVEAAPAAAPAVTSIPSFDFSDGAKQVESLSSPNDVYKALIEHTLRSHWSKPEDLSDDDFAAEVEVSVDKKGQMGDYRWVSGSGNSRWDASVKAALAQVKVINRTPPKGFPEKFNVRFDVESLRTEPVLQLSSQ